MESGLVAHRNGANPTPPSERSPYLRGAFPVCYVTRQVQTFALNRIPGAQKKTGGAGQVEYSHPDLKSAVKEF